MLADVLVSTAWRSGDCPSARSPRVHPMSTPSIEGGLWPSYSWRQGRFGVTLSRDEGSWIVRATSTGRLLGPTETLYEERHTDERHACWDVMSRVVKATRDEDEGLRAGREAARWIATSFGRTALPGT